MPCKLEEEMHLQGPIFQQQKNLYNGLGNVCLFMTCFSSLSLSASPKLRPSKPHPLQCGLSPEKAFQLVDKLRLQQLYHCLAAIAKLHCNMANICCPEDASRSWSATSSRLVCNAWEVAQRTKAALQTSAAFLQPQPPTFSLLCFLVC